MDPRHHHLSLDYSTRLLKGLLVSPYASLWSFFLIANRVNLLINTLHLLKDCSGFPLRGKGAAKILSKASMALDFCNIIANHSFPNSLCSGPAGPCAIPECSSWNLSSGSSLLLKPLLELSFLPDYCIAYFLSLGLCSKVTLSGTFYPASCFFLIYHHWMHSILFIRFVSSNRLSTVTCSWR